MDTRHKVQQEILKRLLFSPSLSFSKLKPSSDMENSRYVFHLDALINEGLVQRTKLQYCLTDKGKEYANRVDSRDLYIRNQAKIGVLPCCSRIHDGYRELLIITRQKHPFWRFQGFPSGKVKYGELILDAALRELKEETNLVGTPKLVGIGHYRVYQPKTRKLLEDKFLFVISVTDVKGVLRSSKEGKAEWITEDELKQCVTKPFANFWDVVNMVTNDRDDIVYVEKDLEGEGF